MNVVGECFAKEKDEIEVTKIGQSNPLFLTVHDIHVTIGICYRP